MYNLIYIFQRLAFSFLSFVVQFLHQKDLAQRILHCLVGCGGTRRYSQDNVLVHIQQERFCHNLTRHVSVRNGIVSANAFRAVNMKRANARQLRNFEQVRRVGGIESTHDQNKVQPQLFCVFRQVVHSILPFLNIK